MSAATEVSGNWSKRCNQCFECFRASSVDGLVEFFHRDRGRSDGYDFRCKSCRAKQRNQPKAPKPKPSLEERFLAKVEKTETCWIWKGSKAGPLHQAYGAIRIGRKMVRAHRWAYTHWRGELKDGQVVCHACDVKLCVNPDHLFAGTMHDNMMDAGRKGLMNRYAGRTHCKRGHALIDENVYTYRGHRRCKPCRLKGQGRE
jgi:hypothetical protein